LCERPDAAARRDRGVFALQLHACLGTSIARLSVKLAFEEFHKVFPSYRRAHDTLPWMPSSTFRSPRVLALAV
jgi:cytochrome P450